jgi:hypothetical protein
MPTTVAGVAALAEHYQDVTLLFEGRRHPAASKMRMGEKSYLFFAARNIARSLKAMAVRSGHRLSV